MGEFCGLTGPAGGGKDLLLNVLGLLEPPEQGTLILGDRLIDWRDLEEIQPLRNELFGFMFEHPCLLGSFSVAENVAMPLFRFCGGDPYQARKRTLEILDFCGITHLEAMLTGRLDAVARRITALARALVHEPDILIVTCTQTDEDLLNLARRVATDLGLCVLWAGEESGLAPVVHRLIQMDGGRIVSDQRS